MNSKIKRSKLFSTKWWFLKKIICDNVNVVGTPLCISNNKGHKLTFTSGFNNKSSLVKKNGKNWSQNAEKLEYHSWSRGSKIMEHLYNYTPLPSEKIRRKINYFMTPYNNSVIHEKFMNFKYLDQNGEFVFSIHYRL